MTDQRCVVIKVCTCCGHRIAETFALSSEAADRHIAKELSITDKQGAPCPFRYEKEAI